MFLLVLILLSTSLVLLRSTYLSSLARRHYIITPNILYIIIARLTAQFLPLGALLSFSATSKLMLINRYPVYPSLQTRKTRLT